MICTKGCIKGRKVDFSWKVEKLLIVPVALHVHVQNPLLKDLSGYIMLRTNRVNPLAIWRATVSAWHNQQSPRGFSYKRMMAIRRVVTTGFA